MSPMPTTIVLNSALNHSVAYDPFDDSITACLPEPIPLNKLPNRLKLLLLIYFCQRDLLNKPRAIDANLARDIRIVEHILFQFTNYAQALRTLAEYSRVGDDVDLSPGWERIKPDKRKQGSTRPSKMTITRQMKERIQVWMNDVLNSDRKSPSNHMSQESKRSIRMAPGRKTGPNRRTSEVIDLSSPTPETGSVSRPALNDDDLEIISGAGQKRKFHGSNAVTDCGILTPGSTTRPRPSSRPSTADGFQKLFPSSPAKSEHTSSSVRNVNDTGGILDPNATEDPVTKAEETGQKINTPETNVEEDDSTEFVSAEENDEMGEVENVNDREDFVETTADDINAIMEKVDSYARHIYLHARKENGDRGVRKYSRKLRRLTQQYLNRHFEPL